MNNIMKYEGKDVPFAGIKKGDTLDSVLMKVKEMALANLERRGLTINKLDYNPNNGTTVFGLTDGSEFEFKGVKRANVKPTKPSIELNPSTPPIKVPNGTNFYKDLAYGNDEKQKLDVFIPSSTAPTGVAVFIHGGGFSSQSKEFFYSGMPSDLIRELLGNGKAVVSINYRLLALKGETEGIKKCWSDAISAVEFLNENSEQLNIQKDNIVLVGASSGAGLAMLVGYCSDVKVNGVVALESQAGYDVLEWDRDVFSSIRDFTQSNVNSIVGASTLLAVYGANSMSDLETPKYIAYRNEVSVLKVLRSGKPELYVMSFQVPNVTPKNVNELYHHPFHASTLASKCKANIMSCKALIPHLRIDTTGGESLEQFIIRKLK